MQNGISEQWSAIFYSMYSLDSVLGGRSQTKKEAMLFDFLYVKCLEWTTRRDRLVVGVEKREE